MERSATVGDLGEDRIIEIFMRAQGSAPAEDDDGALVVPNGDDAAAWRFESSTSATVATTDSLVEGQHFDLAYTPPSSVGRKLLAVNLSDLAAMGARPRFALLSVCFPPSLPATTLEAIADGLADACRRERVTLIGGNTTGTRGPVVLTVTMIGEASTDRLVRRSGVQAGDALFVTGRLGDAAAGLHAALQGGRSDDAEPIGSLVNALVEPTARVAAGLALAETGCVHAMCDVSDGLGRDVRRLLGPYGLRLHADRLPISQALRAYAARTEFTATRFALAGGEDYELLFCGRSEDEPRFIRACRNAGTQVTRIGVITEAPPIEVVLDDGRTEPVPTGFEHFGA